jgi:hypothetical protein
VLQHSKHGRPPECQSRQLELALPDVIDAEKGRRGGSALSLAVAGAVSLIAALVIHAHLLMAVAPLAIGLIVWAAVVWLRNRTIAASRTNPSPASPRQEWPTPAPRSK